MFSVLAFAVVVVPGCSSRSSRPPTVVRETLVKQEWGKRAEAATRVEREEALAVPPAAAPAKAMAAGVSPEMAGRIPEAEAVAPVLEVKRAGVRARGRAEGLVELDPVDQRALPAKRRSTCFGW